MVDAYLIQDSLCRLGARVLGNGFMLDEVVLSARERTKLEANETR